MSTGTPDRWEGTGSENPGPAEGVQPGLATGSQNPGPGNGLPHEGSGSQNPGPEEGVTPMLEGGSQNPGPSEDGGDDPDEDPHSDPEQLKPERLNPRAGGEAVAHPREADTPREPDRPAGT